MLLKEVSGRVCSIHFKSVGWTAEAWHETKIVEHCSRVKELSIKLESSSKPSKCGEIEDSARMIEQQLCFSVANEFGDSFRECAIRYVHRFKSGRGMQV